MLSLVATGYFVYNLYVSFTRETLRFAVRTNSMAAFTLMAASKATVELADPQYPINFAAPGNKVMESLIDLHHDIFSVLIFVVIVVFWMLLMAVISFRKTGE